MRSTFEFYNPNIKNKTDNSLIILKNKTGAGFTDCKVALKEANYDINKAVDILRSNASVRG